MSDRPQQKLDELLKLYLDNMSIHTGHDNLELEVMFGTKGIKRLTRIDYDDVVKRLLSAGFVLGTANYMLRIFNEYVDQRTGETRTSNIRTELSGLGEISRYCKEDTIIDEFGAVKGSFEQKFFFRKGDVTTYPVDFNDYNFRVALKSERKLQNHSRMVKNIANTWADNKKVFRYICRHTLTHPDIPIKIDLSVVKNNKTRGRTPIPVYRIKESGVLESSETYEIEIEVENRMVGIGTVFDTPETLGSALRNAIKQVLCGLQSTNYPVSYEEQGAVAQDYMRLLWGGNTRDNARVYPKNFLGPSSYTLQVQNIAPVNDDAVIPNVRNNYTVTEKADGERKLLYITDKGRVYLITTNMEIEFTGALCQNKELHGSILDGEHIIHNKERAFINLYAAFDLYYLKGRDIRMLGFVPESDADESSQAVETRLPLLKQVVKELQLVSVVKGGLSPLRVESKSFYSDSQSQTIFQACGFILKRVEDGLFEYETDGLIFTPAHMGVGTSEVGKTTKPYKLTWDYSFKWKPPRFNTIDFLVTVKKRKDGTEFIGNIFESGTNTSIATQLTQYKTVILRVGFDERKHGYINPCENIIQGELPSVDNKDDEEGYHPVQFFPTNPTDSEAGICNLVLRDGPSGDKIMLSEEGEVIEDNMIVEFRYDESREGPWRWIPLRVRYDKTADLRSGGRNFGNAYHVANSNWHSLHNPVSAEMISTGRDIPDELGDDDVYYNKVSGSTNTRGLRDFHNLFVKKALITGVSQRGDTLIDLAVGKGGDIPKWIAAKLKFVFGIDISRDNIQNRLDGVCARYLNYRKNFRVMPSALFVHGNSSVNIRDKGEGIYSDKGKQITRAVFGQGAKDAKELGQGVYKEYGIGEEGFNVCSIQFAIHYMFESQASLQNFLRNVSETTKVGGYFIGTSYDGDKIFKMLSGKKQGESAIIMDGEKKMWEVTKGYDREEFPTDSSTVGYAIDVYQESINKTFREYLVNYSYLTRLLENYGFVLLTQDEVRHKRLPGSLGSFSELYGSMTDELKRNRRSANEYGQAPDMSGQERKISFLNNYFIYKKVRNVDADKVSRTLQGTSLEDEADEAEETRQAQEAARLALQPKRKAPKKLKKKLKLKSDPVP